MKWTKETTSELIELVNSEKSLTEIIKILGKTKSSIRNKIRKLGIKIKFKEKFETILKCKNCGNEFSSYIKEKRLFCCKKCSVSYNNINRVHTVNTKINISNGLKKWYSNHDHVNKNLIFIEKITYNRKCKVCKNENVENKKRICDKCKMKYYNFYRPSCEFSFNINIFKKEFDLTLIDKYGWYSPTNKGNNLSGVSKDHMYSVKDGFLNNIEPEIIRHPANCKLMLHSENNSKNTKSSITIQELLDKISKWNEKYESLIGLY